MERNTELLLRVARMYHVQSETMDAIAHQLGVSRSTVSRLLKDARDRGLIRVTIADPERPLTRLSALFERNFRVQAHLVSVRSGSSSVLRLEQVAKVAARLLDDIITDGDTVGVAWGTTTAAIASQLRPRDLAGVRIVGLNGGANDRTTGLPYVGSILQRFAAAYQGEEQLLALPAFFDDPATRVAMWRERSTRHMLSARAACTVAVFGIGSLKSELQSHVYAANYLDDDDLAALEAARVAGDVCTVMVREDGTWRDIPLNHRASGITPDELQQLPRRICVASGAAKAAAVLGAMHAGVATDLVIDEETARAVLNRLRPGLGKV
ncbi:transcriptional regulator [Arachnia propionica]|uniref:Transcriptional regulator n=1 Tax=Arachnia propionica TaxID=1750 RepID=A0A3P1T8D7_9ACTN|nr:sugar-binding domain-containing protein [Arachnia propionica]MDO5083353.1 sugar-binding domain-containing protein [Arachnia propionica]RRD04703.1 transcriptional regulator [Arachnia propionica]